MAKGNTVVTLRLSDEMFANMEKAINSRNNKTQDEPWNVSDFIRHCIRIKLSHGPRAKKAAQKKAAKRKTGMAVAS